MEETNTELRTHNEARTAEVNQLGLEREEHSKELSTLRNRLNLAQQNWNKEREDLVQREAFAREEFGSARQAMQDWEVLAMEERSIRENLGEKVADLEEQVTNSREMNQSLESERSTQALNIDGLQRALRELQDGQYFLLIFELAVLMCFSPEARAARNGREFPVTSSRSTKAAARSPGHSKSCYEGARICTKRA